jgi:hypothetical protein
MIEGSTLRFLNHWTTITAIVDPYQSRSQIEQPESIRACVFKDQHLEMKSSPLKVEYI